MKAVSIETAFFYQYNQVIKNYIQQNLRNNNERNFS